MRYAEEEALIQDKDGLIRLLEIDDYLHETTFKQSYTRLTKK